MFLTELLSELVPPPEPWRPWVSAFAPPSSSPPHVDPEGPGGPGGDNELPVSPASVRVLLFELGTNTLPCFSSAAA